jgi:hypothetical protein
MISKRMSLLIEHASHVVQRQLRLLIVFPPPQHQHLLKRNTHEAYVETCRTGGSPTAARHLEDTAGVAAHAVAVARVAAQAAVDGATQQQILQQQYNIPSPASISSSSMSPTSSTTPKSQNKRQRDAPAAAAHVVAAATTTTTTSSSGDAKSSVAKKPGAKSRRTVAALDQQGVNLADDADMVEWFHEVARNAGVAHVIGRMPVQVIREFTVQYLLTTLIPPRANLLSLMLPHEANPSHPGQVAMRAGAGVQPPSPAVAPPPVAPLAAATPNRVPAMVSSTPPAIATPSSLILMSTVVAPPAPVSAPTGPPPSSSSSSPSCVSDSRDDMMGSGDQD